MLPFLSPDYAIECALFLTIPAKIKTSSKRREGKLLFKRIMLDSSRKKNSAARRLFLFQERKAEKEQPHYVGVYCESYLMVATRPF